MPASLRQHDRRDRGWRFTRRGAITISQVNPKSGTSRLRYDKYKAATSVGQFLELSDSTSKGWQDLLN